VNKIKLMLVKYKWHMLTFLTFVFVLFFHKFKKTDKVQNLKNETMRKILESKSNVIDEIIDLKKKDLILSKESAEEYRKEISVLEQSRVKINEANSDKTLRELSEAFNRLNN